MGTYQVQSTKAMLSRVRASVYDSIHCLYRMVTAGLVEPRLRGRIKFPRSLINVDLSSPSHHRRQLHRDIDLTALHGVLDNTSMDQ
jgi:hypothetical protein